jgi:hypothetical protein
MARSVAFLYRVGLAELTKVAEGVTVASDLHGGGQSRR